MQGVAFLLALALLTGCGAGGGGTIADDGGRSSSRADSRKPSSAEIAAPASRQLIIKFAPDTVACDAAGIARLSIETRVSLEFVRTMSGGACVVKQSADGAGGLSKGLETLGKHPAVEYAEPDAVMKTH